MMTTAPIRPAFRLHPMLWAAAAALLLVPAAAMMVTPEVNWGAGDFAVFGLMLGVLCLGLEAAWHGLGTGLPRFAGVLLAVLAFLLVWAELAVGLFD